MKSTHECEQEINSKGLLVESKCAEEHVFRPFSSGSSGAMTEVYYKIRFVKESPGIRSRQGMYIIMPSFKKCKIFVAHKSLRFLLPQQTLFSDAFEWQ